MEKLITPRFSFRLNYPFPQGRKYFINIIIFLYIAFHDGVSYLERMIGAAPTPTAWKAVILLLYYTRVLMLPFNNILTMICKPFLNNNSL